MHQSLSSRLICCHDVDSSMMCRAIFSEKTSRVRTRSFMLQAYCEVLCIVYAEAFFELAVMIIKSL